MHHQLDVWLTTPEFANRGHNQPMPREGECNAESKRADLAQGCPLGTTLRLLDVLQDASRIVQEQCPRSAQSNAARQPVEQEESDLPLQILDLPRQGGLRD